MSRIVGRSASLLVLMLGAGCGAGSASPVSSPSLPPAGYPTEYVETADSHIEVSGRRVGDFGHVTFTGSHIQQAAIFESEETDDRGRAVPRLQHLLTVQRWANKAPVGGRPRGPEPK